MLLHSETTTTASTATLVMRPFVWIYNNLEPVTSKQNILTRALNGFTNETSNCLITEEFTFYWFRSTNEIWPNDRDRHLNAAM